MTEDRELFEAARAVRPFLADLIPHEATAVDRQLAETLLSDEPVAERLDRIQTIFAGYQSLIDWIDQFAEAGLMPPEVFEAITRSSAWSSKKLAGDPSVVRGIRFVCPNGDFERSVLRRGQEIPPCPTCNLSLVQADRQ